MQGVKPALRATSAAASSEPCGVAVRIFSTRAKMGSPGLGVSQTSLLRCAMTAAGASILYLAMTASASWRVVASGTVGPEAMTERSSFGTSEIISATTRAGAAARAKRPPLMAERCLRTQFISEIVAPLFKSALLTACFSSSVTPSAGSAMSAEPPPEISASTRSSSVRPWTAFKMRAAASRPAASGTGCEASMTSICDVGAPCS